MPFQLLLPLAVIIALSNTTFKDGKQKSNTSKRSKLDKENYCNKELEKQIQKEIERAENQSMAKRSKSSGEEKKMGDEVEEIKDEVEKDMEKLIFYFAISRPVTIPKCKISRRVPVTPTKIFGDMKFFKRPINDLSSTPKLVLQKNPRITKIIENILLGQILSKLEKLFKTVKSQTAHILSLKKKLRTYLPTQKGISIQLKPIKLLQRKLKQWRIE